MKHEPTQDLFGANRALIVNEQLLTNRIPDEPTSWNVDFGCRIINLSVCANNGSIAYSQYVGEWHRQGRRGGFVQVSSFARFGRIDENPNERQHSRFSCADGLFRRAVFGSAFRAFANARQTRY